MDENSRARCQRASLSRNFRHYLIGQSPGFLVTARRGKRPMIVLRRIAAVALALCGLCLGASHSLSADLGPEPRYQLPQPASSLNNQWQFSFTPYLWLPWMTGDVVVKGRALDVSVDPAQLIDHLNWPDIVPAWMSHAE